MSASALFRTGLSKNSLEPLLHPDRNAYVQISCNPGHTRGQNGEAAFTLVSLRRGRDRRGCPPPGEDVLGESQLHDVLKML